MVDSEYHEVRIVRWIKQIVFWGLTTLVLALVGYVGSYWFFIRNHAAIGMPGGVPSVVVTFPNDRYLQLYGPLVEMNLFEGQIWRRPENAGLREWRDQILKGSGSTSGANGMQPFSLETNRVSPAAASGRSR